MQSLNFVAIHYQESDCATLIANCILPIIRALEVGKSSVKYYWLERSQCKGHHLRFYYALEDDNYNSIVKSISAPRIETFLKDFPPKLEIVKLPINDFFINYPNGYVAWERQIKIRPELFDNIVLDFDFFNRITDITMKITIESHGKSHSHFKRGAERYYRLILSILNEGTSDDLKLTCKKFVKEISYRPMDHDRKNIDILNTKKWVKPNNTLNNSVQEILSDNEQKWLDFLTCIKSRVKGRRKWYLFSRTSEMLSNQLGLTYEHEIRIYYSIYHSS